MIRQFIEGSIRDVHFANIPLDEEFENRIGQGEDWSITKIGSVKKIQI